MEIFETLSKKFSKLKPKFSDMSEAKYRYT